MDQQQMNDYLKGAVEALLFISDKPVEIEPMKEALETFESGEIRQAIKMLQAEYEQHSRGMRIVEIAGGFQMLTNPHYAEYLRNFFKTRVKEKLSRPALEALAILAYRQPVSRADVELIRGVNSDGVVTHLLEKGLIKIVGRKDVPGRPFLYGTTKLFLEYFGLKTLKDLPKLEDVSELLSRADQSGGQGRPAGLFDSNKARSVEDAVTDFGGDDHVRQAFVPVDHEEGLPADNRNSDGEFASSGEDQEPLVGDSGRGEEYQLEEECAQDIDEGGEVREAPEDLKRVMEEMNRDHSSYDGDCGIQNNREDDDAGVPAGLEGLENKGEEPCL